MGAPNKAADNSGPAEVSDEEIAETLVEELGRKALQIRALNLERSRGRRQAQLAKKDVAIALAKEEIAERRAQIVLWQAEADSTANTMREIDAQSAEIQSRLKLLTSKRASRDPESGTEGEPLKDKAGAVEVLAHAHEALQEFNHFDSDGQQLLRDFIGQIELMRIIAT